MSGAIPSGPARCPVCRAQRAPEATAETPCRRCGSDLSLVHATYRDAGRAVALARAALAGNDAGTAEAWARRAVQLLDVTATRETLAACLAAAGREGSAREVLAAPRGRS